MKRAMLVAILMFVTVLASGATKRTVFDFNNGTGGGHPMAGLVFDQAGTLYGSAAYGGSEECQFGGECGVIFMLSRPTHGGIWTQTVLYTYGDQTDDGGPPDSGLVLDQQGNLYGTDGLTGLGGSLFQLTPPPGGNGEWTFHSVPAGQPPIFDKAGNLYTAGSGDFGYGSIVELTPNPDGTFSSTTLYSFTGGNDGSGPSAVVMDGAGNLYGTTFTGGSSTGCNGHSCGTVFQLAPPIRPGTSWTKATLHSFQGKDGGNPPSGVVLDAKGNLYGAAEGYGNPACTTYSGCGVVFKLHPQTDGTWKETTIHKFKGGNDGANPMARPIFDKAGNLYGTTYVGGGGLCLLEGSIVGCGTVYKLSPPSGGSGWTETHLHRFQDGSDGSYLYGGVVFDAKGALYGTTSFGGIYGDGSVYKIVP